MTCQVAVMNKNGLALATDTAVTLGKQKKVYHNAEKLFRMSDSEPVAAMTYGCAEILGVPWGTVVKMYRRELGTRRFDVLDQYAEDFLRYLEGSDLLFPKEAQVECLRDHVHSYWQDLFLADVWKKFGDHTPSWPAEAWTALSESVAADREIWTRYGELATVGPSFGDRVLATYRSTLDELQSLLFDGVSLPPEVKEGLHHAVRMMHQQDYFWPSTVSGLVIAGFGEREPFPRVLHFSLDTVVAGRLRYKKVGEGVVTRASDAHVMPFAQTHMVDLFYRGIFPSVHDQAVEILRSVLQDRLAPAASDGLPSPDPGAEEAATTSERTANGVDVEAVVDTFVDRLRAESRDSYTSPLITAVGALPLSELCELAETLVSLTAFRARMAADQPSETVGGDIDVAAISKGDGFVWVQHKELVGTTPRHCRVKPA